MGGELWLKGSGWWKAAPAHEEPGLGPVCSDVWKACWNGVGDACVLLPGEPENSLCDHQAVYKTTQALEALQVPWFQ